MVGAEAAPLHRYQQRGASLSNTMTLQLLGLQRGARGSRSDRTCSSLRAPWVAWA